MKRILSLALSALLAASALASCAAPTAPIASSSDISASVEFLNSRVADTSDIIVGDADKAASFGIDMTGFEDSGYTIRRIDGQTAILAKTADGVDRAVRDFVKHKDDPSYEVTVGEGFRIKRLTVCGNDIADYAIVLPADEGTYPECLEYAATELRDLIKQACGAELEITSEAPASGKGFFLIPARDADGDLGEDGFKNTVSGGRVTIRGGSIRGCLCGVYDFAEDVLGYRFFTDRDTYIYPAENIDAADGYSVRELPGLHGRNVEDGSVQYTEVKSMMTDAKYCARRRNFGTSTNKAEYGYNPAFRVTHAISRYAGAMWDSQPCSYDDGVFETVIENAMKELDAASESGELERTEHLINLGQNDNNRFCVCRDCRAQEKKTLSRAGCTLDFANRVAETLCEYYPNVLVGIYAYWGAIIPPRGMTAHPNVTVSYVMYGFCKIHPISGVNCDPNHHFQENLNNLVHADYIAEWSKMCERVHLREYDTNYWCGLLPYYNVDDYLDNFRYYADCGVYGVTCDFGESQMTFDELFVYLESLLSWDPQMTEEDFDSAMREFMEYYYGDGWELLYDYIKAACRVRDKMTCGSDEPYEWYADNYGYLISLFDEAAEMANSAQQVRRIERTSLHVRYTALCGMYESRYVNGTDESRAELQRMADRIRDGIFEYNFIYWGTAVSEPADKKVFDTNFDLSALDPKKWW